VKQLVKMPTILARVAGESQAMDKLRKLFLSAGSYSNLVMVVGRVFQRVPWLVREMEDQLDGMSTTRKKSTLVELVMSKITELVCDSPNLAQELGLPNKIWHYLAYTDLVVARVKDNTKQWAVYLLRDFPANQQAASLIDEEGYMLRTKFKMILKEMGLVVGVQTEAEEDRIWFRVSTTKKTKDRIKDMERVHKAKPTLIVYYPGEPYFYSVPNMMEVLSSSLARCLGCLGSQELPLAGKCVASLRRLRLGRDGRDGPTDKARLDMDRFTVVGRQEQDVAMKENQPKLDKVTVSCEMELEGMGEKLGMTLVTVGHDVIGGLMDMVELGIIDKPAPMWVANLPTAGRNKFHLVEGGRAAGLGREMDNESVVSRLDRESVVSMV